MKTSIYNKSEHLEGYVEQNEPDKQKSDVQKAYEKGNEGNEVTAYGRETVAKENAEWPKEITAKDGMDNSGTQGKDSLSDDSYNSHDEENTITSAASRTGSSSDDFKNKTAPGQRTEDDILNSGI
ncbi:hypothetical protein ACJVDH_17180 [Pedobacter sp. AW1-32]|uniref:hypothetical protein n=1 Tax=Pedobacter sp. AW1-32 TaxID=3383026 RepID=UPI003FF10C20